MEDKILHKFLDELTKTSDTLKKQLIAWQSICYTLIGVIVLILAGAFWYFYNTEYVYEEIIHSETTQEGDYNNNNIKSLNSGIEISNGDYTNGKTEK